MTQVQKNDSKMAKGNKQKKLLLAGTILIAILLSAVIYLSVRIINNPLVYSGVYLDGVHLAGLDEEKLMDYLQNKYEINISSLSMTVFHKNYPLTVPFEEINVHINKQTIFNQIYSSGREGGLINRLIEIYRLQKNHLYLKTEVFADMKAMDRLIEDIYDKTYVAAGSPSLLLMENEVYIQSGECGYAVNREKLKERMIQQVNQLQSGIVIVPVDEILPARVDIDSFYNQIIQQPQDASVEIVNNEVRINHEVTGRTLDKAAFLSSVAELEAKSVKYPYELKLPVVFVQPGRTAEAIQTSLFRDELSTYKTSFPVKTAMDKNRAENIRLAVAAINGTILLPGKTFSFNEVVGVRTTEKGYREANIYTSNGISLGIGGGICQVSSTLYNVFLEANMKIDERNPHIYTVAYIPLGRDAAISYGSEDLRFTNSTSWPVKIIGKVSGSEVSFTLLGTNENPSLQVVVQPSVLKILPFTTEYVEDKSLAAGSSVVKQAGMNGAVVDTFYSLKSGKDIISSTKLHTTTYKALPEIILVPPGNNP